MEYSPTDQKPANVWLKGYTWLSGIVIAFLASYLMAVLTAIVPAPKVFLCKLSLGFCPEPKIIAFSAVDIDRIIDHDGVGQAVNTSQIGMLHNHVNPNVQRPNMVKYRVTSDVSGNYKLRILYAAGEERPVQIYVNDNKVAADALRKTTDGWDNQHRTWYPDITVHLNKGENTLMLTRANIFPHLSKFELIQVTEM